MKKNYKSKIKIEFRTEKLIEKKGDKLHVKWKSFDNSFNSHIDKKDSIKMRQYIPKPYESYSGNVKAKLDLFNYATKVNLKEQQVLRRLV